METHPKAFRFTAAAVLAAGLILATASLSPRSGLAQTADQRSAVVAVIESQLQAFRQNDGSGAYRHAAPNIQDMFGTVDVFMDMVRRGYGFLIDPAVVEFLDVKAERADLLQAVRVIGRDGTRKIAIYRMERQADGSWKIAGVYITEDPQAAV